MTWHWANFTEHYFLSRSFPHLVNQIDSFLRCYCPRRFVSQSFQGSSEEKVGQLPGNKDASSRLQDETKFSYVVKKGIYIVSESDLELDLPKFFLRFSEKILMFLKS